MRKQRSIILLEVLKCAESKHEFPQPFQRKDGLRLHHLGTNKSVRMFESDEEEGQGFQINKKFAVSFEGRERRNELQRAKELEESESEDSSDESESDEDLEIVPPEISLQIVKTINSIRRKDPKIYDKSTKWFPDEIESGPTTASTKSKQTFKDVLRNQLLKHGADIDDEKGSQKKNRGISYDNEQEQLRQALIRSAGDVSESEGDSSGEDVFKQKSSSTLADNRELRSALEEMRQLGRNSTETDQDLFLSEYISKRKWVDENEEELESDNDVKEVVGLEEDEEELEKIDKFESKYNFRFEELQNAQDDSAGLKGVEVVGHARSVEGSIRRVDDKRKIQREQRLEQKAKERRRKDEELKRLKSLKKQELQERLRKIGEVGGLKELVRGSGSGEAVGPLNEDVLDEEWDPEKHDALMQQQFGSEYYDEQDNDPLFATAAGMKEDNDVTLDEADLQLLEGDFEEGTEFATSSTLSGRAQKLRAAAAVEEELYKLDYEDIVAGIPCRFKYRKVEAEDFGLTIDDILLAEDAELNQFVSLSKLNPYRSNRRKAAAGEGSADADGGEGGELKVSKKRKRLRAAVRERLAREAEVARSEGAELKGAKQVLEKLSASARSGGDEIGGEDGGIDEGRQGGEGEEVKVKKSIEGQPLSAEGETGKKKRRRRKLKDAPEQSKVDIPSSASVEAAGEEGASQVASNDATTAPRAPVVPAKAAQQSKSGRRSAGGLGSGLSSGQPSTTKKIKVKSTEKAEGQRRLGLYK